MNASKWLPGDVITLGNEYAGCSEWRLIEHENADRPTTAPQIWKAEPKTDKSVGGLEFALPMRVMFKASEVSKVVPGWRTGQKRRIRMRNSGVLAEGFLTNQTADGALWILQCDGAQVWASPSEWSELISEAPALASAANAWAAGQLRRGPIFDDITRGPDENEGGGSRWEYRLKERAKGIVWWVEARVVGDGTAPWISGIRVRESWPSELLEEAAADSAATPSAVVPAELRRPDADGAEKLERLKRAMGPWLAKGIMHTPIFPDFPAPPSISVPSEFRYDPPIMRSKPFYIDGLDGGTGKPTPAPRAQVSTNGRDWVDYGKLGDRDPFHRYPFTRFRDADGKTWGQRDARSVACGEAGCKEPGRTRVIVGGATAILCDPHYLADERAVAREVRLNCASDNLAARVRMAEMDYNASGPAGPVHGERDSCHPKPFGGIWRIR